MLIDLSNSSLAVIDMQQKLLAAMNDAARAVDNVVRLTTAAAILDIPVVVTEQNATKLGPTIEALHPVADKAINKTAFDVSAVDQVNDALEGNRDAVILVGCEAHVCVLQSAFGFLKKGKRVYVVADATASRHPESWREAMKRMRTNGIEIVTMEMVLFEWLGSSDHPQFRAVQNLIK